MPPVTNYRVEVSANAARPFVCRSCRLSTYATASGTGEWTHGAAGWGHSGAQAEHHRAEAAATARALAVHQGDLLIRLARCPQCGERDRGHVWGHAITTSFWTLLLGGGGAVALYLAYLWLFAKSASTVAGLFMCLLALVGGYLAQQTLRRALRSYREAPSAVRFDPSGKQAERKERRERARTRRGRRGAPTEH